MGAYATALPGGLAVTAENVAKLSAQYGFDLPTQPGMTTPHMLAAAGRGEIDVLFAVGGNFKEVLPGPDKTDSTLGKIPLRVHMDITLSSQMLVDPADTVILLPAATRYEIPGGVTETSTERRVIFSPEIKGRRPGEARPEGDVLSEIAARVRPEIAGKVRFGSTQAIRDEIAQVIPFYAGIEKLRAEGDQFQYGGALLCDGWNFPTYDGKAHFKPLVVPEVELGEGEFTVVTRRGKQFNSMVHEDHETYNRLDRGAFLINADDARRMGLAEGDAVVLSNRFGSMRGVLAFTEMASGTIQVYFPEANVLLDPDKLSPLANIPAYKSGRAKLARWTEGAQVSPEVKV
jgi:predicted molibdopterin-dependent oxidoreductase YjgC